MLGHSISKNESSGQRDCSLEWREIKLRSFFLCRMSVSYLNFHYCTYRADLSMVALRLSRASTLVFKKCRIIKQFVRIK